MDPRRWRFGTRLWVAYTVLITLVVLALSAYVWSGARSTLESGALERVEARAAVAHDVLVPRIAAGTFDAAAADDAATAALGSDPALFGAISIRVVDAVGTVLAERGFPGGPGVSAEDGAARAALAAGLTRWSGFVTPSSGDPRAIVYRALPGATGAGSMPAYVRVTSSASEIATTLGELALVLASGVVLAAGLGAVIGAVIVRNGLRPLRDMATASRAMAAGDLDARISGPASVDEIGLLARDFNVMADRLEAAFERQRAFVADASHELRTPLTALGGQLDVLARAAPDDAEALRRSMRRQIDRMNRLTDDLLLLARFDEPSVAATAPRPTDLAAIARDVVEEARALPMAGDRTVTLTGDEAVPITADPEHLHRAVLNLVVNGVQHTTPGTRVDVDVRAGSSTVEVRVRDHGPGFAPEDLERVFDRFHRSDAARSTGGTGLGLAIARAIVEAHGGTIAATNADDGALLTLRLPIRPLP